MFLLIHTMTITECDFVLQAQFFHALGRDQRRLEDAKLVGRRLSLRLQPNPTRRSRQKANLHQPPALKTLMKRNSAHIRHHVRTIQISPPAKSYEFKSEPPVAESKPAVTPPPAVVASLNSISERRPVEEDNSEKDLLIDASKPEHTVHWLTANRFEKYIDTFSCFSGADMLRMSREDLIQICGQADGIRLYNAIHLKAIAPKLTIYVCRENNKVFNALFLSSHASSEIVQKLSALVGVARDQVRDVYIQGPHSIHILLSNDVISRIKEEAMFSLDVLQDNGSYVFLLKPATK